MHAKVIHLLTETDVFSDVHGAAIQRWVANVLRFEDEPAIVACSRADSSWGLGHVKPLQLPGLWAYSKIRGRYRLPWSIRAPLLRRILSPALDELKPGSVAWIHNRPDYAAAIEPEVRARGARLVLHLHNSNPVPSPGRVLASSSPDRVIFCSRYLESEVRQSYPELTRTTVIHNGADERRFFPAERPRTAKDACRTPLVLFAGRLVPEKGAHVFIEAMWLLLARDIRVRGRVLGATGFGSANRPTAYSRSLLRNVPRNVEFGGYCRASEFAQELRRADIFCSPSVWAEPFGLVNVEAMATALPVVATRAGGVPEIFAGGGGVLVPRDSATELAAAIERLVRNERSRQKMAAEGYASFLKNYTWRTVHRRYRETLRSLDQNGTAETGGRGSMTYPLTAEAEEELSCQPSR